MIISIHGGLVIEWNLKNKNEIKKFSLNFLSSAFLGADHSHNREYLLLYSGKDFY